MYESRNNKTPDNLGLTKYICRRSMVCSNSMQKKNPIYLYAFEKKVASVWHSSPLLRRKQLILNNRRG